MKKMKNFVYVGAIALLGMLVLTACSSGDEAAAEPSPNYNPESNEVVAQFIFNISTGNTPTMRQTSAATQASASETFRGIDNAVLLSYKQGTDGKHLAAAVSADKRFDLSRILGQATIDADNSHRVIETSLPLNTNSLLFYGKAIRGSVSEGKDANDVFGYLQDYTIAEGAEGLNLSKTNFELCPRINGHKEDFAKIGKLLGGVLTVIMNTNLAGDNHVAIHAADYTFDVGTDEYPANLTWASFNTTDGKSPIETGHVLYPLEVKLADAYREMTTIRDSEGELRAGYGEAILSTITDLWSVINEVRCATPFSKPEAVAKYLAERIHERIKEYFSGTVPDNGMNVTGVKFETTSNMINHLVADTAWPTSADTKPTAADLASIKDARLADFPLRMYRVAVGAAHYMFDKEKKQFFYVEDYNTSAVGGGGFTVESYFYPPELVYFGNSPIRVSNDEHKPDTYPNGVANWDDDTKWTSSWTKNSHVTSATQSVAMVNDINYGTSLMKTTISYGSDKLYDNNHAIQYAKDNTISATDEPDKEIAVTGTLFQLTGVLIGGQWKQVGWDFIPKSSGNKQGYVYDCDIVNSAIPATGKSTPNYTLVFDNYNTVTPNTQDKVYVALELVNNGEDFFGEHGIVPHGGIFYLIGELNPTSVDAPTWPTHHPLPPYNADGSSIKTPRVFMQDYMTTANFVIGANSLKHAYLTVPDLRYSALTLGLSVNIEWSTGLNFGDVILGGEQ